MERSAIKSWILANDVGSGKTMIYGQAIVNGYLHLKNKSSLEEITCGPTLILTPANTAIQTWKELTDNFSQLRVVISYGSAESNGANTQLAGCTLNDDD